MQRPQFTSSDNAPLPIPQLPQLIKAAAGDATSGGEGAADQMNDPASKAADSPRGGTRHTALPQDDSSAAMGALFAAAVDAAWRTPRTEEETDRCVPAPALSARAVLPLGWGVSIAKGFNVPPPQLSPQIMLGAFGKRNSRGGDSLDELADGSGPQRSPRNGVGSRTAPSTPRQTVQRRPHTNHGVRRHAYPGQGDALPELRATSSIHSSREDRATH